LWGFYFVLKEPHPKEKRLRESGLVSQSIDPGPADSAIFEVANGMSIAADMAKWDRTTGKGSKRKDAASL